MRSFRKIREFVLNCFTFPRITQLSRPLRKLIISIPFAITSPKTHAEPGQQAAAPLDLLASTAAESTNTIKKATAARNASTSSTKSLQKRLFVRTALPQTVVLLHAIAANALLGTPPTTNRLMRLCLRGNCKPPNRLNDRFFSNTSISI